MKNMPSFKPTPEELEGKSEEEIQKIDKAFSVANEKLKKENADSKTGTVIDLSEYFEGEQKINYVETFSRKSQELIDEIKGESKSYEEIMPTQDSLLNLERETRRNEMVEKINFLIDDAKAKNDESLNKTINKLETAKLYIESFTYLK